MALTTTDTPVLTRRQQQAADTKKRIFNAALAVLKEKSFEKITVRDIVKKADVSIGSFYNSYSSKLEVFYDTYRFADDYFENTVSGRLTQESGVSRILAFFEEYAVYNADITPFPLTKIIYNSDNTRFNRDESYGMLHILENQIRYAQNRGEFSVDCTAKEAAHFMMISIRGLVYDWCIRNAGFDLKSKMLMHSRLLLRCFAPSGT